MAEITENSPVAAHHKGRKPRTLPLELLLSVSHDDGAGTRSYLRATRGACFSLPPGTSPAFGQAEACPTASWLDSVFSAPPQ